MNTLPTPPAGAIRSVEEIRSVGRDLKKNSQLAYRQDLKRFFSAGYSIVCTTSDIERYLVESAQGLNGSRLAPDSLARFLSSFRKMYRHDPRLSGLRDPSLSQSVQEIMAGIRATWGAAAKKAPHIRIEHLQTLYQHLSEQAESASHELLRAAAARDCALIAVGFWRGLRADTIGAIRRSGVSIDGSGVLWLYLPREKQVRDHVGRHLSFEPWPLLDPVPPMRRWLEHLPSHEGAVLFPAIHKTRGIRTPEKGLDRQSIGRMLKARMEEIGAAAPKTFSAHSLRHSLGYWGGQHLGLKELMDQGGWKSVKSVSSYIKDNRRIASVAQAVNSEFKRLTVIPTSTPAQ